MGRTKWFIDYRSSRVIDGMDPRGWSMDWVNRGGPWTGSAVLVPELGSHRQSMKWIQWDGP